MMMSRKLFWLKSLVVFVALSVLSLGSVQAQVCTAGQIMKMFDNQCTPTDSVITEDANGNIAVGSGAASIVGANNTLALQDLGCGAGIGTVTPMNCFNYQFLGQSNGGTFINSSGLGGIHFRHNNVQADQMTILPNGNVGIGGNPGYGYRLQLPNIGSPAGRGLANAWYTYSSRRWKENITPIDNALAKVERLRGVYYDWKETRVHDMGFLAEEVGEVIPEVVSYEANGKDAQAVDYARLTALLVEAVKELKSENEALKHRLAALESK